MEECCVCHETEELTAVELRCGHAKVITVKFCKSHLTRLKPKQLIPIQKVTEKEDWREVLCCATPINENGHCAICGDKY
jgi:hypothetical protein